MYTPDQMCEKIRSISPDVGECGKNIKTCYDPDNKAWIVELRNGNRKLSTYVEPEDADACVVGDKCLGLGLQIHQLKDNVGFKRGHA